MPAIIVPSPAEIRRHLKFLWKEDPSFFWCPDEPKNFFRDQARGIIGAQVDQASVSFGGLVNPFAGIRRGLYFPTSAGITDGGDSFLGVALVSVPDPSAVRGCFVKIGGAANGWGFGAGGTSFDTSGSKGIALRENVAWIDSGPANYFIRGLNVLVFGRTTGDTVTMMNLSNGSAETSAGTNTDLSPSAEIYINGYTTGAADRGSGEIVHAVVLIKRTMDGTQYATLRDQVIGPRLSAFVKSTPQGLDARALFTPISKIIYFPSAGGGGATLTADSGSYALTGTAATIAAGRKLTADAGTYSLTGTAATLAVGRKLTAEPGTYSVTGTSVDFLRGYSLTAESGGYSVSGTDAAIKLGRLLAAESGSYTLTGTDVTLTYQQAGSYSLTADAGSYALTGTAAALRVTRTLTAEAGSYSLTGADVTLRRGYAVQADTGSYALTGAAVAFARTYVLGAESGSYTLTGSDAGLTWSAAPVVETPAHGGPSIYGKAVFREAEFRREYERETARIEAERIRAIQLREDEELVIIMAALAA